MIDFYYKISEEVAKLMVFSSVFLKIFIRLFLWFNLQFS